MAKKTGTEMQARGPEEESNQAEEEEARREEKNTPEGAAPSAKKADEKRSRTAQKKERGKAKRKRPKMAKARRRAEHYKDYERDWKGGRTMNQRSETRISRGKGIGVRDAQNRRGAGEQNRWDRQRSRNGREEKNNE